MVRGRLWSGRCWFVGGGAVVVGGGGAVVVGGWVAVAI